MAHYIDAMGKACPQPVILAKQALDAGQVPLTIDVDNPTAVENLKRMAASPGHRGPGFRSGRPLFRHLPAKWSSRPSPGSKGRLWGIHRQGLGRRWRHNPRWQPDEDVPLHPFPERGCPRPPFCL